jgi:hypothetical protein
MTAEWMTGVTINFLVGLCFRLMRMERLRMGDSVGKC